MQFCLRHWAELKKAIRDRGLWDFVSGSGEEVAARMKRSLDAEAPTTDNWDPLMSAHSRIFEESVKVNGLAVMADGFCPICVSVGGGVAEGNWINGAADEQRNVAVHYGLLKPN